jgi:hypothetical protein
MYVQNLMKHIALLNWLVAAQPNMQKNVQAAEPKSGCGKFKQGEGRHQQSNPFHSSYI